MSITTRQYKAYGSYGFALNRGQVGLVRAHGTYIGTTDTNAYLGLYTTTLSVASAAALGTPLVPNANQVPVWESQILTKATGFNENCQLAVPQIPGPVYCGLSTVSGSYTAASSDTADIFLDVEEWEEEPPTLTQVTISGAASNTIWSDTTAAPSAAKALYDIIAYDRGNSAGAQLYLQLFAITPVAGTIPIKCWEIPISGTPGANINLNGAILLNFGDSQRGGWIPLENSGGTLNGAALYGSGGGGGLGNPISALYFGISITATSFTAAGNTAAYAVARYSTPAL